MDTRDILLATESAKRLIQDDNYYKYIFKKTERIVSVVFYILNSVELNNRTTHHVEDLQHAARTVHDAVLQSLETRIHSAEDIVRAVAQRLVALESKLTVAQVAGVLDAKVLAVFQNEIDAVLRGMKKYIGEDEELLNSSFSVDAPIARRAPREQRSQPATTAASTTSVGGSSTAAQPDRRARILTILEAKPESSIKDISDIIKDVSEKTIQRELNAMIEDNLIKRQGERRWSKYSIF